MMTTTPKNDTTLQNLVTANRELLFEVQQIKNDLQKLQAQKIARLEDSLYSPQLFAHYEKVAHFMAKSTMVPKSYIGQPNNIFIAMAMGYQLGFSVEQSLQDIAVINGRPCLWGDGLLALALAHPECQDIIEEPILQGSEIIGYRCTVLRKGQQPHTKQFTLQDAKLAGLFGNNVWGKYPSRMLQMRARSLAIRDKFADALRGIRIFEIEQEDDSIIEGEVTSPVDKSSSQTAILKQTLKKRKGDAQNENSTHDLQDVSQSQDPNSQAPSDECTESNQVVEIGEQADSIPDQSKSSIALATEDQLKEIETLIEAIRFPQSKIDEAFKFFKIKLLDELSFQQANIFIKRLRVDHVG